MLVLRLQRGPRPLRLLPPPCALYETGVWGFPSESWVCDANDNDVAITQTGVPTLCQATWPLVLDHWSFSNIAVIPWSKRFVWQRECSHLDLRVRWPERSVKLNAWYKGGTEYLLPGIDTRPAKHSYLQWGSLRAADKCICHWPHAVSCSRRFPRK